MPGAGDALIAFARSNAHPFFRDQATLTLAEAGDLRAVPLLAQLLRQDVRTVYASGSGNQRISVQDISYRQ